MHMALSSIRYSIWHIRWEYLCTKQPSRGWIQRQSHFNKWQSYSLLLVSKVKTTSLPKGQSLLWIILLFFNLHRNPGRPRRSHIPNANLDMHALFADQRWPINSGQLDCIRQNPFVFTWQGLNVDGRHQDANLRFRGEGICGTLSRRTEIFPDGFGGDLASPIQKVK